VTGFSGVCSALSEGGAVSAHLLTFRYIAVASVVGAYRLLAERSRRKTLVALLSRASTNTVMFIDKGPGGPAMYVKVGRSWQEAPQAEVLRERQ
jgi:hypothetical protein